ncbi:LETM1-like protein-domain-containing protein [Sphaerosporella brunnea]|uniref:LETM1-like protein-domain-containing protein n=1 Tax=Sphaerosporella brunnea TaxID=1250544 RepID=A0A5J5EGW0_9PEZI|nr:LETM1-like protein-domain-containing protein [Sphaerosporella brunnea]
MNSSRLILNSSAVQRTLINSTVRRYALPRTTIGLTASRLQGARYRLPRSGPSLFFVTRDLSTQTTPATGPPTGPPPGFDVEAAKKPLPLPDRPVKSELTPLQQAEKELAHAKEAVADGKSSASSSAAKDGTEVSSADGKQVTKGKEEKKATLWEKVKHGVQHFWDGTKLLGVEIKISWNLALKMAAGYELSRRERRQLERTVKDLGRLVPFSVFIIVPAGELFLPIALKIFPNLLPSTYEDQKQKDAKMSKLRTTRKDVSQFIRTTMKEGGILPIGPKTRQREEFTQFFKKIRTSGESPTREELIKVCKIFKDDVTLDNLSRPQLVAMCRYMNLSTLGTDAILRYNIRHRLRQLKRDDRAISYEGIESLTVPELQNACASRGIRTHGVSPARLRDDLNTWLELRLKHGLPSTLLVLSNAFMYAQGTQATELDSHYDALQAVLSSIPEELYHEIELEIDSAEGAATNKQRLEVFKEQQELIDEENEERQTSPVHEAPYYDRDIDEKVADIAVAKEQAQQASGTEELARVVSSAKAATKKTEQKHA